jgi:hypothetical protein
MENEKKKSMILKNVPDDVKKYLLERQAIMKIERNLAQYSLEQTIYKIIREQKEGK